MFKKSATLVTALAAVAMLAAPAAALADDVAPDAPVLEEAAPVEETPVEVPAPVAPLAEEAPAPVVEAPAPVEEPAPVDVDPYPEEPTPDPVVDPYPPTPTPETKTLKWTLPDGGAPDKVTWPQPVFSPGSIPCGTSVWVQVDVYPYTSESDKARTDALDDDGVLTKGEDYGWVKTWTFERYVAPACPLLEVPYPNLLANEVCGKDNDTVYVDPAWVEKYGHLVAGPWIDTKYKTIDGKRVVDGSAQIKAEFRKTHIWAGTGDTSASDFRRWMMYPGTSAFTHEDTATVCPPIDVPANPEEPEEPVTPVTPEKPVVKPVVAKAVTPEATGLAETGLDTTWALTGGAVGVAALALGTLLFARRRQTASMTDSE